MKKLIQLFVVAIVMFGIAAATSWTWTLQNSKSAEEGSAHEKPVHDASAEKESSESGAHHEKKPSAHKEEPAISTRRRPERTPSVDEGLTRNASKSMYAPGLEDTVKMATSLKEQRAQVREKEDQLTARQRQLELVIENIRSERKAIDDLREELDEVLREGEGRLEGRLAEVEQKKAELEIKQQDIDGRVTEMTGSEKGNIKKMAALYDSMPADSAAKIFQQMVDTGTMDTAVKLLSNMVEKKAARVLAEMSNNSPQIAAQLSERLKNVKNPKTPKKE
jgi:flagellar motility protein MotE (MotC chaperone)